MKWLFFVFSISSIILTSCFPEPDVEPTDFRDAYLGTFTYEEMSYCWDATNGSTDTTYITVESEITKSDLNENILLILKCPVVMNKSNKTFTFSSNTETGMNSHGQFFGLDELYLSIQTPNPSGQGICTDYYTGDRVK